MAPRGRQKIPIRRIESEEARHVCFSKRRAGLFNKASELSLLCGADVAAVVFSPAGKAFCFGHPSAEAITDRFLLAAAAADVVVESSSCIIIPAYTTGHHQPADSELNRRYGELRALLGAEKARRQRLDAAMDKERAEGAAWIDAMDKGVSAMGPADLLAFRAALAQVQVHVAARADQILRDALLAARQPAALQISAAPGFGGLHLQQGFEFGGGHHHQYFFN